MPKVYVSEVPAELIVTLGKAKLEKVEGTELLVVVNTESDLFLYGKESRFYYLVSGRWFRANSLGGSWQFASHDLPEDFAKIPQDHPMADVRASVPGTPEAQEAVLLAQIPQTAKVDRSKVTAEVSYVGEPEFKPIEGTSMSYATNTQSDVIKVGDMYYLCYQGVWFVSASASGPWEVTDKVPETIYTIPPSSPIYHTTYVQVYDSGPDYVTYGYTSGYWGVYSSYGCMVYGTGWYYNPYYYYGSYYPYPVYYGYPYSYGVGAYYNSYTGTYGRGATLYGPYGGVAGGSRFNPNTGTYSRGAAAYGPYNARGWAEAYNPRTGTYAQTRQGANALFEMGHDLSAARVTSGRVRRATATVAVPWREHAPRAAVRLWRSAEIRVVVEWPRRPAAISMQVATVMSIVGETTVGRSGRPVSGPPRSAHLTAPVIAPLIDPVNDLAAGRRRPRRPTGPGVRKPVEPAPSARAVARSISSIAIVPVEAGGTQRTGQFGSWKSSGGARPNRGSFGGGSFGGGRGGGGARRRR